MVTNWRSCLLENRFVGVLLFDLSAAFDTLDADILCKKLALLGFDTVTRLWIHSYMTKRNQFVTYLGKNSTMKETNIGSPQGGILSPLLFLLYISDIGLSTNADVSTYADDTTMSVADDDIESLKRRMEKEGESILKFMACNQLVANAEKTELMIIGKHGTKTQGETIKLGGATIVSKDNVKLLGMHISSDLSWNFHINSLIPKLNQGLGLLKRLATRLPRATLLPVVHGALLSKLRYGIALFGNVRISEEDPLSKTMQELQVVLNNTMRFLANKKIADRITIEDLRERTKIPSVNQIAAEAILMEIFNAMKNQVPFVTEKLRFALGGTEGVRTRAMECNNLVVPKPSESRMGCVVTKGIRLWNQLPSDIKTESKTTIFKKKVKEYCKGLPV